MPSNHYLSPPKKQFSLEVVDAAYERLLPKLVAKQKQYGGRLVRYKRVCSVLILVIRQDRIEHVPHGQSRTIAGLWHCLFTLLLGPWSIKGLFYTPYALILNLCGGADVTAQFSDSSIDPHHDVKPDPEQAEKDDHFAMIVFIVFVLSVVIGFGWLMFHYGHK